MRISGTVRQLLPSEWSTYRDLRLRSLEDSPDAFGSTLTAEQSLSAKEWAARLASGANSGLDFPLIAEVDRQGAGLAWAKVDATDSTIVHVYQMWVAPEYRGEGLGRMLLRAAVEWSRARNAGAVHLMVSCGDTAARRLYAREGFAPVGEREPLRPGSPLFAQPMRLSLAGPKHVTLDAIRLRPATAADAEFIYCLVEATMRVYVEQIWGSFGEEYNRKNIAESIGTGTYSLIEHEGLDIGALAVERHSTHIQLTQIYILPSHQNRGIGTSLVRHLAGEARTAGKPLRLRVLSGNPARKLYEREGFKVTQVTPERVFMELDA